ncbi:MAG TPA: VOC family protein [Thermoanaerobaculia bacterium]|nr:VOC family protein [Thermoanaerobaculia bacterium]
MLTLMVLLMVGGGTMTEQSGLASAKIGQVALTVSDIQKAREFYEGKLGLKLAIDAGSMLFFDCGGTMLLLSLPEKDLGVAADGAAIYLSVDRIDDRWKELKARGVTFVDEPHLIHRDGGRSLWMTFFRDPDGHLLALMSWQAHT